MSLYLPNSPIFTMWTEVTDNGVQVLRIRSCWNDVTIKDFGDFIGATVETIHGLEDPGGKTILVHFPEILAGYRFTEDELQAENIRLEAPEPWRPAVIRDTPEAEERGIRTIDVKRKVGGFQIIVSDIDVRVRTYDPFRIFIDDFDLFIDANGSSYGGYKEPND